MKFYLKLAVGFAAAGVALPVAATTSVHIGSAGIYSPGTVVVTKSTGASTVYSGLVTFTGNTASGSSFDIIGFCVDLYHEISVNIGSQLPVSLDYHRDQLTTDGNGFALTSAQSMQIGGLANLGFGIARSSDPDKFAKLAAIQQAIWTIEYPTFTFDGSGSSFAGQQAYAAAYVAAAPSLKGAARAFYADNGSTQGFVVAGVPEPASWALMIGGFGLIGVSARRRRGVATVAS